MKLSTYALTLLSLAAVLPQVGRAATINWSAAYISAAGTSQISQNGVLQEAVNFGFAAATATTAAVGGVTFTGFVHASTAPGGTVTTNASTPRLTTGLDAADDGNYVPATGAGVGAYPGYTGNPAYLPLLDGGLWDDAATVADRTSTLTGLIGGSTYEIQIFLADLRDAPFALNRYMTITDGNGGTFGSLATTNISLTSAAANRGNGLILTGVFTANATTQSFENNLIDADVPATLVGPQYNAYQLRLIPEPSAVACSLLALGLGVGRRRRKV